MSSRLYSSAGRPFRGLLPEQRQQQRRERLIEAGLEVFGTRAYHTVRVRDVCVQARLTERYFYESFPNLEALFRAVYEQAVARVRLAMESAIADTPGSVSQVTRAALRVLLVSLKSEPRLARILLIDVLTVGNDVAESSRLATEAFADLVSAALAAREPAFPGPNRDPRLVASGLVGSTVYLLMQWAFNGFHQPVDVMLEHCAQFYDQAIQWCSAADEPPPPPR